MGANPPISAMRYYAAIYRVDNNVVPHGYRLAIQIYMPALAIDARIHKRVTGIMRQIVKEQSGTSAMMRAANASGVTPNTAHGYPIEAPQTASAHAAGVHPRQAAYCLANHPDSGLARRLQCLANHPDHPRRDRPPPPRPAPHDEAHTPQTKNPSFQKCVQKIRPISVKPLTTPDKRKPR